MTPLLPPIIAERLMAFRREAGVVGIWARVALTTKGEAEWVIAHPDSLAPGRPPEWAEKADGELTVRATGAGFRATAAIDPKLPRMGRIVVLWNADPQKQLASLAEAWARQIGQTLRDYRRHEGAVRLLGLLTAPATIESARNALKDWATALQDLLGADGVKVTWARRSVEGPVTAQAVNTKYGLAEQGPTVVPYSADFGLADWVLRRGEWLLSPSMREDGELVQLGSNFVGFRRWCLTGSGKHEQVTFRPEKMVNPAGNDDETSMLSFPLKTDNAVTGVVAAWRFRGVDDEPEPAPFDADFDVEVFQQFAPHGAAACQRLLQLERMQDQFEENRSLATVLAQANTLAEGFGAVAKSVGRLADAPVVLLFRVEVKSDGAALYEVARWNDPSLESSLAGVPPFHLSVSGPSSGWASQMSPALVVTRGLELRTLLLPPAGGTSERAKLPRIVLALFDREPVENGPSFFSDELLLQLATSFVQSAEAVLENQGSSLGSRLVDRLVGPSPKGGESTAEKVMAEATEPLVTLLGADAGLLYLGSPSHMRITQTWPPTSGLVGIEVTKNSRTEKCIQTKEAVAVVDNLQDSEGLDALALERICRGLGWRRVRSWLCCPLVYQGRVIGLWKFLTRGTGRFLGPDHLEVVKKVAPHAAWEAQRAARRTVLSESLKLSTAVAGKHGEELEHGLVGELEKWIAHVLQRKAGQVAVLARLERERFFLFAASRGIKEQDLAGDLDRLSLRLHGQPLGGGEGKPLPSSLAPLASHVLAEPLLIPANQRLAGHVFVFDHEIFDAEERDALRELARTLAVILNAERERNEIKAALSRYRHAVLGPVQGAMSNALALADLAKSTPDSPALNQFKTRLLEEVQILRLWRENQPFYQAESVQLICCLVSTARLHAIVERSVRRYEEIADGRKLKLRVAGDIRRGGRVYLDENAIDLVVSNLVDNAVKYAFYSTTITIQLRRAGGSVELSVEDIGHGIGDDVIAESFEGKRVAGFDPFRWITGSGLGLALSRRIVEAHSGSIEASSHLVARGQKPETSPYRVRIKISLPMASRGGNDY
jgi:signal transduction histidine kinase